MNPVSPKEASGLWRLYHQCLKDGDTNLALKCARRGVHFCSHERDMKQAGIWQRAVANCLFLRGRYEQAVAAARRACDKQPDDFERALSYIQVGAFLPYLDKCDEAFRFFDLAAELMKAFPNDSYLQMHFFGARALARRRTGDFVWALIDWEGAAYATRRVGLIWRAAGYINNIGLLFAKMGELESGERRLREALEMLEEDPHPHTEACIKDSLGHVLFLKGDHVNALRLLKAAAESFTKLGDNSQLGPTLFHLAELHEELGGYSKARDEATRAFKLARKLKNSELGANALELLDRLPKWAEEPEFVYELNGTAEFG